MSLSFLLTSLIVVVSPGTGVLYTLATALTRGSRASVAAALGCTLGILPAMAMTFVVFVLYGLFAGAVRDRVVTRPRVMSWLRRAFAGGFALLGAKLAFAER